MKYVKFLLTSTLYVVVLLAAYVIHVKFFRVNVVFYSSITDSVIATVLTMVIVSLVRWLNAFTAFEKTLLACIWLFLGYSFAISVPTVIDRSLSFYTLEKLQQRGGGIKLSAFEGVYAREYMKEHRLVDVRLTEQQQSGTIVIQDGCVRLTPWGNTLANISRYFRANFLPKERLLMGGYSSDLTNPFRASETNVDSQCK